VNTRGQPQGKFTFTSHEAGDHTICLRSNYTGGWFSTPQVRMHLDIAVGEAKVDEEGEKEHVKDLAGKVKDLNARLADIRREQQFQREREAEFRTLSEKTNSRAVWWSVVQVVTLFGTCTWQLRYLRAFFASKKLYVRAPSDLGVSRTDGVDGLIGDERAQGDGGSSRAGLVGIDLVFNISPSSLVSALYLLGVTDMA
jgi:hypothetical protein